MSNTRDTGFLRNLISYDSSGNIVLPANLTVTGTLLTSGGATYATQSYVTTQITNLVNAAPGVLDTLGELSTALGNDANFATTVTNSIAAKQAALSGTGFVKISGTTISYDNSTYLTTSSAASTYLPLTGGTVTGLTTFYNADSYSEQARFGGGANNRYLYTYVDSYGVGLSTGTGFGGESIYFNPVSNYIDFSVNSSSVTRIVNGGRMLIGNGYFADDNVNKLQVSGGIRLTGALTGDSATFSSSVTATSLQLGDYTGNPTLTFAATNNGISKINFYDQNYTEGLYLRTDGEPYGGTMTFGARWDDDEAKIVFKMYQSSAGASYDTRVGIGTTSPSYNLSVASYLGVGAQGGGDIVLIGGGSGVGAFIQLRYATGTANVHLAGNGNSYLNAYYGNTGIGTTNPASTLSVQGEIAKYCTVSGVDGNFQNLIKYGYVSDLQSGNSTANRWLGIDATVTAGAAVTNTLRIRAYAGGTGNAAPANVVDFRGDQSSVFYGYIRHNTRVFSGNSYVGNLSSNLNPAYSRNYLLVCDLNNAAGFSLNGQMNAASYTCWNMSSFWIMKNYSSTNGSAGITGMYKGGGCDMNIVDLNYAGGRYIAIGYTSNPEVNGMWIGYRVNHMLNADGTAIVVPDSSVSINTTYATY